MSWTETTVGEVITTKKGFAFKSSKYVENGVPIVRVSDYTLDSISDTDLKYYPMEEKSDYLEFELHEKDVIVQTVGSWQNNPASVVGKVVRVPYYLEGSLLNQNAVRLTPIEGVDNNYLFYRLRTDEFKGHVLGEARGAANQASITLDTIKSFKFQIPDYESQVHIGKILATYDELIENNQKKIKLLEEVAQRLYKEWFVDLHFPGYEDVAIIDGVPEGWHMGTIDEVVIYHDKIRKPLSSMQRANFKGQYRYYGAAGILDYVQKYLFEGTYLLLGEDGSVITKEGTPVLQYVTGKFWVNNHAHVLTGKLPFSTEYIYMMFKEMGISDVVTGVAQPKISQARLSAKKILIPNCNIAEYYQEKVKGMFEHILILERQVELLIQARDRLLPKLMSGEIEV